MMTTTTTTTTTLALARAFARRRGACVRSFASASTSAPTIASRASVVGRPIPRRRGDEDAVGGETEDVVFDGASASVETLAAWLRARGVDDTRLRRERGGKDVEDLLREIRLGESVLAETGTSTRGDGDGDGDGDARGCSRRVRVVSVRVRRPNDDRDDDDDSTRCLVEVEQRYAGDDEDVARRRNRPLSEKMYPRETWRDAARRAVREELGSALAEDASMTILEDTYAVRVVEEESASYPGLRTRFTLHRVDAVVRGLPAEDEFRTVERTPRGVLLATWRYQPFAWSDVD